MRLDSFKDPTAPVFYERTVSCRYDTLARVLPIFEVPSYRLSEVNVESEGKFLNVGRPADSKKKAVERERDGFHFASPC